MKYMNANEILPVCLVEELQKYIQAGYLYNSCKSRAAQSLGRSIRLPKRA